jgi:hypothetical protein
LNVRVHGVSDVRQIEIHTAQPLVPDPSTFEVEIAITKLERYKSPGSGQIPAELLSRLSPYIDVIIGDHQCGFRRNRTTTDQIFYIRQML